MTLCLTSVIRGICRVVKRVVSWRQPTEKNITKSPCSLNVTHARRFFMRRSLTKPASLNVLVLVSACEVGSNVT